jgi:hypothetical protein
MTDPVTEAGRALLDHEMGDRDVPGNDLYLSADEVRAAIIAIEQEAAALARAEAGGVSVEALLDAWEAQEHPSIDAAIQAALAARSAGSGSLVECGWCNGSGAIMGGQTCLDCHGSGTRPTPPPAGATQVPLPATDSTPPPAVDVHALAESASAQRATKVDAEYHALRAARPTPPPAVDGTPTDAVEAAYQALLAMGHPVRARSGDTLVGLLRDDGFDIVPRTPPAPAVDGTRCGFRLGCGGRPDDPQHQRPFSGWGSMTAHDFEPNTPPPAVDGTRCAECGGVKDDVFHVPCLVGGPFHYVKTCHPFTPPTPAPAVDGTRVCGHARAEDGICGHTEQWEGHRSKAIVGGIHEFVPFTPPTPAPDRLQALEAALDHAEKNLGVIALTLTDHPEYPMKAADVDAARSLARFTAQDIRAARDLLADGERS